MKNPKNSKYWKKRYEILQESLLKPADKYCEDLKNMYIDTIRDIEKEISIWYQRFADNNGIVSMAEARKKLDKKELEELQWDIMQYIKAGEENGITKDWTEKLENASARWHISRLEALKIQTQQKIEELYGGREEDVKALLGDIYTEGNYKNAYEIAQKTGTSFEFAKIDDNRLNKVLNKPWTIDDKIFSERIWQDRGKLVNTVHKELTKGILTGNSSINIAKNISKKMNSDLYSSQRLVLTESAYFATEAQKDCYKSLDVDKYEVLGTLDRLTCEECGDMDGKVFDRKDMAAGINAPPFHPNCRCTTIPFFDDELTIKEDRVAIDKDGKTIYVDDMSYKDWKEKFIKKEGPQIWDYYEKGAKNKSADKEQYKRYKTVLGKNAPKTLEDFQKLKYTAPESYSFVKLDYKRQNTLLENPELKLPNASSAVAADKKFSHYLFNPENSEGYAKGKAFTSRLGYDIINYNELQKEIIYSAPRYPAIFKDNNGYGNRYEQKIVLYGKNNTPANVIVGWLCNDDGTKLTSAYIKEV